MATYRSLLIWALGVAAVGAPTTSCSNTADQCEKTGTCNPAAVAGRTGASSSSAGTGVGANPTGMSGTSSGGSSGGAAGSGSAGIAGVAGSGNAGHAGAAVTAGAAATAGAAGAAGAEEVAPETAGAAGAPPTIPCNGKCSDPTPICDTQSDLCVACLDDTNCGGATPACRTSDNTCVGCTKDMPHCSGATPICDGAANQCVGCLTNEHCAGSTPWCKTETHTCVGCVEAKDCTSANASRCDTTTNTCTPCVTNSDCASVAGKGVCASGTCVQCTGKEYAACGQLEGKSLVCDSLKQTCTSDKKAQSSGPCQTCVSDAQCLTGQLCALQSYGGKPVGYFCFWKQDASGAGVVDCTAEKNRPYVKVEAGVTSVDNQTATLCTLRNSTCVALNQYSSTSCGPAGAPNDQLCGYAPGLDSKCTVFGTTQYRCTTTCLTDDDCIGSGTASSIKCDLNLTPRICTLQ